MNKLRSDSAFCQLTSEQVDALEGWLFEERLGYPQVLEKLKAEFGLETSLTGVRRFYKRLEMERSRAGLMDAVEMSGLAVEALKSGTFKPGMLVLANKCAFELMMQSAPPIREVTALLRAITSAEAQAMKQTVFEREETERRERERVKKAAESWRITPADLEEEREELRQEREAEEQKRHLSPALSPKGGEGERPITETFNIQHSSAVASDAMADKTSNVEGNDRVTAASGGEGEEREAGQVDGAKPKTNGGGTWQPSVLEERECAGARTAEEAENRLTPLNAA